MFEKKVGFGFYEDAGSTETLDILLKWRQYIRIDDIRDVVETATGDVVGTMYLVMCPQFIGDEIKKELYKLHPERYDWPEVTVKVNKDGSTQEIA